MNDKDFIKQLAIKKQNLYDLSKLRVSARRSSMGVINFTISNLNISSDEFEKIVFYYKDIINSHDLKHVFDAFVFHITALNIKS
jgi:hypothetical protein